MIGIIVIYSVVSIYIISFGIYHIHVRKKDRHIAEENLDKAVSEAFDDGYKKGFDDGYKKGFADGEQQGYRDGKMFSQIAAHNESVLRKQGVIK